ncbi:MAG: DUF432 domain-containing protein [Desulfurococcales archaeon]|nr:DUF432 domain-containing protein [Desulfurococcales archaeon]
MNGSPWGDIGRDSKAFEWKGCGASISFDSNGKILRACDRYGCSEIIVDPPVRVIPAPPILRPFSITSVVFIGFTRRAFVQKHQTIWAKIPLDIEIAKDRQTLAVLATSKVKYRLVGSLVEGVIARNVMSDISFTTPPTPGPCEALVALKIARGSDVIDGVPFNVGSSVLYSDRGERLYTSLVEVSLDHVIIDAKTTAYPPLPGLKQVRRPPYGRNVRLLSIGQPAVTVERGWRLWPTLKG